MAGYGYLVPDGYLGMVGKNNYMLFATEEDYKEYIAEWSEPTIVYRPTNSPRFIFEKRAQNG